MRKERKEKKERKERKDKRIETAILFTTTTLISQKRKMKVTFVLNTIN